MNMTMETDRMIQTGKSPITRRKPSQCHLVQYKSLIDWSPHYQTAKWEVVTAVFTKIQAFRHATPCRLLNSYRHFKKAQCLLLQGQAPLYLRLSLSPEWLCFMIPTPWLAAFFEIKKYATNTTVLTRCSPDSTSRREMRLCPSCRSTNRSPTCRLAWNKKTVIVIFIITQSRARISWLVN